MDKESCNLRARQLYKRVTLGRSIIQEDMKLNYLYEKLKQLDLEESYLY